MPWLSSHDRVPFAVHESQWTPSVSEHCSQEELGSVECSSLAQPVCSTCHT